MIERRRTDRVYLRIPVRVQGLDLRGEPFSEESATVEVNRDGARIAVKSALRIGDEVRVTNAVTGASVLCRIAVECPRTLSDSPEWGISLAASASDVVADFWGITFEDLPKPPLPHISALLNCSVCGLRELVALSRVEYDVLREDFVLTRVCQACRTATDWEPVDLQRPASTPARIQAAPGSTEAAGTLDSALKAGAEASEEAPLADRTPDRNGDLAQEVRKEESEDSGAASGGRERRVARRVPVRVPILVHAPDGETEVTVTRDVSKTGLSFPTSLHVNRGDTIGVVVGHGVVAAPVRQAASVEWRRPHEGTGRAMVGIRFSAPAEASTPAAETPVAKKK
jgi:PilZ domain